MDVDGAISGLASGRSKRGLPCRICAKVPVGTVGMKHCGRLARGVDNSLSRLGTGA